MYRALFLVCLILTGCDNIKEVDIRNDNKYCINGHLYLRYKGFAPLFDYRTDVPTLIQCRKVGDRVEFDVDKLK